MMPEILMSLKNILITILLLSVISACVNQAIVVYLFSFMP